MSRMAAQGLPSPEIVQGSCVSSYLYCVSSGSSNISRIKTPSVQNLIMVTPCVRHLLGSVLN